jgi:ribosome-binding factor A
LRLRHVPELHFIHDDSVEHGSHIDQLIDKALHADKDAHEGTLADAEESEKD